MNQQSIKVNIYFKYILSLEDITHKCPLHQYLRFLCCTKLDSLQTAEVGVVQMGGELEKAFKERLICEALSKFTEEPEKGFTLY